MDWIRRYWLAIGGFILSAGGAIFRYAKEIISLFGDIDLLVERSRDPGWVGDMMGFLLDPPGWLILAVVIAGLLAIYVDVRRNRKSVEFSAAMKPQNPALPGFAAHIVFQIQYQEEIRRKYFFQYTADGLGSVSLLMSPNNILKFLVVDKYGDHYPLEAAMGDGGFSLYEPLYVGAEVGIASGYTLLRLRINGKTYAEKRLEFPIQLGAIRFDAGELGANVAKEDRAKFFLYELIARGITLSSSEQAQLDRYISEKHGIALV
jgi:hypothetical protein